MESKDIKSILIETYAYTEDVMFAEGLDDAIIGFSENDWRVVYSKSKCIEIRVAEGMNEEEALEELEYNTFSAYMGKKTPIWVDTFDW